MEEAKILVFVTVFLVFLAVARKFLPGKTTYNPADRPPSSGPDLVASGYAVPNQEDAGGSQRILVGADLPFPISLPPRQANPNGRYNRPVVLNYYFKKLDLVRGPDDPRSFCDEFFIQFEEPEMQAVWTNEYIVATPAGLQHLLESGGHDSLHFDGMLIVVPKWNVANLLKIIMAEVMDGYGTSRAPKENSKKKEAERYWI